MILLEKKKNKNAENSLSKLIKIHFLFIIFFETHILADSIGDSYLGSLNYSQYHHDSNRLNHRQANYSNHGVSDFDVEASFLKSRIKKINSITNLPNEISSLITEYAIVPYQNIFIKVKVVVTRKLDVPPNYTCDCSKHEYNLKINFYEINTLQDLKQEIWEECQRLEKEKIKDVCHQIGSHACWNVLELEPKYYAKEGIQVYFSDSDKKLITEENFGTILKNCLAFGDDQFIEDNYLKCSFIYIMRHCGNCR